MISAIQLKNHLQRVFYLAETDGISFKVKHRPTQRVYLFTLEPLGEKYSPTKGLQRKRRADRKANVALTITDCKVCGSLIIGETCINRQCKGKAG